MSSALFVYFRRCNRLLNTSVRFTLCSSGAKIHNNSSFTSVAISNPSDVSSLNGRHANSWLWSVRNYRHSRFQNGNNFKYAYYLMFIPVVIKRLFGYEEEEEMDPEALLILNIKRSILLIREGEKEKGEQMLHIALKMAQDQQNQDGITYIYDIMANLAFDNEEFAKAEKLFVDVMRRCLLNGMKQDDNKFIHMNLKLAKVYHYSNRTEQCELGYKFCVNALEKKIGTNKDDEDTVLLWCLTLDWFGRFLLEKGRGQEGLSYLTKAYDTLVQFGGENHPQNLLLLHDLGIAHSMLGNDTAALEFFDKALKLGNEVDDPLVPNIMVNMGLLFLRKLNLENAKEWCSKGLQAAKKFEDYESEQEARNCLSAIPNKK